MDASSLAPRRLSLLMPYLAILRHDLRALLASRLVRLWLGATALLTLLLTGSNWANFQDGTLIASLLGKILNLITSLGHSASQLKHR